MRRYDLTNKKTMTKTKTMTVTKTMTITKTFREHPKRATLETCDLWDFWSEWWGDMTWPTKKTMTMTKTMKKTKTMTIEEHPQRTILETCDLWDTDYVSNNWEQQSQHSQWSLNKEWQCSCWLCPTPPAHLGGILATCVQINPASRHTNWGAVKGLLYCLDLK